MTPGAIRRVEVRPLRLALRRPVRTAHAELRERSGFLLVLETAVARGVGEALPLAGFGVEDEARCARALEAIAASLIGRDALALDERLDALERMGGEVGRAPAARAAADVALHDLVGRQRGRRVAELLADGPAPRGRVPVNALVTAVTPEGVARQVAEARARGFRTVKLKVAADPSDAAVDAARVAAARRAAGPACAIRVDANGAWSDSGVAGQRIEELARFDLEWVEQPVPAGAIDVLAKLRARGRVAIAADESVAGEDSARRVLDAQAADVLVLKVPALGGLRAARRVALEARAAGVATSVTSFLDSGVGIAAALHLAAALPELPFAAGLATQAQLARDLIEPLPIEAGCMRLPASPGLGVAPSPARLARVAGPARWERAA